MLALDIYVYMLKYIKRVRVKIEYIGEEWL